MIKTQFYSDLLKKSFDTEKEAVQAEKIYKEKLKQQEEAKKAELKKQEEARALRAQRAKEVEDAMKTAYDAQQRATVLLSQFIKDYGSFHSTLARPVHTSPMFRELFDIFFK